ncbi:MAG: transcriptional regulator [Paenibacillus sp.]|jgi:TetR/AcrR family transcriptional repressor of nem operon|uniref:TetR/AcrR family transcriptional regulator n=1 Tax=Paenibacillus sp. GCM10012303 TaxID=3317340 RepID=UPI0029EC28CC|nr:transcriptional regulator [Paenibacillus sp.]
MVRPREFDEDQALNAALDLFWEKGYEAASLSELSERMGIQKPSIYAAFGDKKALFEAALRLYTKQHSSRIRAVLQKPATVKEAFRFLFEDLIEKEYTGARNKGCFCINTMVELSPHDEKFAILTREHQMYLSAIFEETLKRGVITGELNRELDVKALSQTLVVSLIGLTVIMKSRPNRSFADHSKDVILSLIQ